MRALLIVITTCVVAGYAFGGRLSGLSTTRFRWWGLAVAGLLLQVGPVPGPILVPLLIASFAMLVVFALVNVRLSGFALVFVGITMNAVVITANFGMPVTRYALEESGQRDTIAILNSMDQTKHHIATDNDVLLVLSDWIPVPPPVKQAISIGDLVMWVGAGIFVVSAMRHPVVAPHAELAPSGPGDGVER
ncbi:MAG: DUF5317 domain-containing protein [Actinomycetota bacterium]